MGNRYQGRKQIDPANDAGELAVPDDRQAAPR